MTKKERRQVGRVPATATNGGFRAGKRRRGNSLLKQAPVTVTRVQGFDVIDANGFTIARNVKTFVCKPICECGNGTGHCPIHGFN